MEREARKLNIAIVSEFHVAGLAGGGERRIYELSRRLVARGHRVTWICMCQPGKGDFEGIHVLPLGSLVKSPPQRSLNNFASYSLRLFWHLCRTKYDIVDAQTYSPLLISYFASLFSRTPMLGTVHDVRTSSGNDFHQMDPLARAIESVVLRIPARALITVSQFTRNALVSRYKRSPDQVHVVSNAVTTEIISRSPLPHKERELIFVGRLVPGKGIQHFIDLCDTLECRGAIIGQGPLLAQIEQECSRRPHIEFIGRLENYADVIGEMKQSKVLVLPSSREGFGLVLAEAAAAGIPTVAYSAGGVAEVIVDKVTGFLVEPGDSAGLAVAARTALEPENCKRMGDSAQRHVAHNFSWDRSVVELEGLYRKYALP
ncbi:glycosyltransferase family 1 protein [Halioglobus maricola]|uniref:Glycosyltransferase family 1 protein n=1 Tax=Halioglobus maricola TaxID=2601894 RepID=A0A5P9NF59_9GAMM|nr:glycosyltransferase family 4 protein [Halioglobus maricola]QFU74403.1 glycosyltransferase family 1 protein [Halioglobus maricola]